MNSQTFFVNSIDRVDISNSSSDFYINIKDLSSDLDDLQLNIKNVNIPHSYYNVNSSNNVLNFGVSASPYTMPVGEYNVDTFQTEFLKNSVGVTLAYNTLNRKMTYYAPAPFQINAYRQPFLGLSDGIHNSVGITASTLV